MFCRTTKSGIVILILYVDDMVITGSNSAAISFLKQHLQTEFEMKDLGFLRYFLGIEVAYSSRAIYSHSKSIFQTFLLEPLIMTQVSLTPRPATLPWSCTSSFDMMTGHLFHILLTTESLLGHLSTLLLPNQTSPR